MQEGHDSEREAAGHWSWSGGDAGQAPPLSADTAPSQAVTCRTVTFMPLGPLPLPCQVVIANTQPTLRVVATLPIAEATGLEWAMRQLYAVTPTHVYTAFVGGACVESAS